MTKTTSTPNYELLEALCQGSDRQIDDQLKRILLAVVPGAVERLADIASACDRTPEVRAALHRALDLGAYGSLASGLVMEIISMEWERLGGSRDDPAPWRDEAPWS